MALTKLLVLSLACLCAYGFPSPSELAIRNTTIYRNTIFGDEKLQGEIFENIDAFDNVELAPRNTISPYRLPTTTRPRHYKIFWILDFSRDPQTQSGDVDIELYATQANVNEIVIQADELEIISVSLSLNNVVIPTTFTLESDYQFLRVRLTEGTLVYNAANPVYYNLKIYFGANLRDNMYGIYRSWYRNDPNAAAVSWMASTQFQATAARWAFPCYDEPSFKATFDVTIRRPLAYSSWFCTKLVRTETPDNNAYRDDVYSTTPVMSTYLLALIVAEYTSTDTTGIASHEVIARPSAISTGQGVYADATGQKLLAEMSSHTAYDFYLQSPNLKMTQAAIPDFGAGAMENWGLLTYREAYLLYDEADTNSHFKQIIAYILSHEIAHMWFGNLVTCDWWDALWLNEGFARYYQYFLTYWVEDMGFATRFITDQVHTALLSDSANNPQPLTNPGVGSPASVSAMFSTISYNKGAAIIRMSEHLLGFEVHRQGLRNYLSGKSFQTALPIDLFEYLEKAGIEAGALNYGSQFSFIDYYKSWTDQPGHPVLKVDVNHSTGEMTIYQRRFNINSGYSDVPTNYIVPITFASASNPDFNNTKPTHIMSTAVTVINRNSVGDEWVIFNKQQTGFYRVNYDDYTWDLIVLALRGPDRTLIHEYNRAQIVNDVFQFARSGIMSYTRAFNILSFLEFETDYAPWVAAMTGFSWLRNRLASAATTAELAQINELIAMWSSNVMATLTYDPTPGEPFMTSYLRLQLAPIMCNIGVTACTNSALVQFQALQNTNTAVAVDNRNWVYCNGLRTGGAAAFNFLWSRFKAHNVYTEKILILQNAGCTTNQASLFEFLDDIVDDNYIVRPQDYTSALNSAVSGNEENTLRVFEYIKANTAKVSNAFNGLGTPLSYVYARLRSPADIDEFETWVRQNEQLLGTSLYYSVLNGTQVTRESLEWTESIRPDINNYLVNRDDVITTSTAAPESTTVVVTTLRPSISEPATPSLPPLPDSAVTTFVSASAVILAAMVNLIL